jgi:hypothetical protein
MVAIKRLRMRTPFPKLDFRLSLDGRNGETVVWSDFLQNLQVGGQRDGR